MSQLQLYWQNIRHFVIVYFFAFLTMILIFSRFRNGISLAGLWVIGLGGILLWAYLTIRYFYGTEKNQLQSQNILQSYQKQAESYKQQIHDLLENKKKKQGHSQPQQGMAQLESLYQQVETWVENVNQLIEQASILRQSDLIQRDLLAVPKAIAELEARIRTEADPAVKADLEQALNSRRQQRAMLQELQSATRRADSRLEQTVSQLGTIYSQLLVAQSTNSIADYSRLSEAVTEEVDRLQDHLSALREVRLQENDSPPTNF